MAAWFDSLSPITQGFLATLGTYLLTVVGTLPVFFLTRVSGRLMAGLSAFAAGVMVAASCWSLLVPALDRGGVFPAGAGLVAGGVFVYALSQWVPHEHPDASTAGGSRHRPLLLLIAMTIHNIPEGLAVGVAYGGEVVGRATALAIGIGIQNVPEGLAIAIPLRRQGMSRAKAFWYGQLSAAVEPLAGPAGAALVTAVRSVLPYGMAFAAGAMLYVVVSELMPDATRRGSMTVAAFGFLAGFTAMMTLDNAFG